MSDFLYIWYHWVACYQNVFKSLRLGLEFKSNDLSWWSTESFGQLAFLQSIHCSSFQQIFLLGL